jgi:hypothetical protein
VRTDELIVQLAREAGPVQPLAPPSVRLARWTAAAVPMSALGVIAFGPRGDVLTAIHQPVFVGLAVASLVTALLSAAGAFVLSVPGAERSPLQRVMPLVAGSLWALVLVVLLITGGDPVRRVLDFPLHPACVIEIAAVGVVPGWALFAMLRRAAPLRRAWSAGLATLAAVALGAVATQFICPLDDPAHQLVGHVLPVAFLAVFGAIAGRRSLNWLVSRPRSAGL